MAVFVMTTVEVMAVMVAVKVCGGCGALMVMVMMPVINTWCNETAKRE
jgi:hypothetical protein